MVLYCRHGVGSAQITVKSDGEQEGSVQPREMAEKSLKTASAFRKVLSPGLAAVLILVRHAQHSSFSSVFAFGFCITTEFSGTWGPLHARRLGSHAVVREIQHPSNSLAGLACTEA